MARSSADVALVVIDDRGRIIHWSEAATRRFGHDAADVVGRSVDLLVPEEHLEDHRAGLARVMAGGEPHLDGAAINLPVRTADGGVSAFPARFNLVRGPHGQVVGAVAAFGPRTGDEAPWSPIEPTSDHDDPGRSGA